MLETYQTNSFDMRGIKVRRRVTELALDGVIRWGLALLLTLVLVGYPIAGSIAQILNLDSQVTSYPFRGGVLALSVFLILAIIARQKYEIAALVGVFLVLYALRLIFDFQAGGYPEIETDLIYFLATVIAPTIAMGSSRYYNEHLTSRMVMAIGSVACLMILFGLQTSNISGSEISFTTRATFEALNAISISYTGLFTAAAGYTLMTTSPSRSRIAIAIPAMILGLTVLIVGGSRGPLVAASMFLAIYAFTRTTGIFALLFAVFGAFMLVSIVGQDLAIVQRFTDFSRDASVWERLYVQQLSIDAALASPIFGSSYVEPVTMAYPHNLLIESAMALGIFGLTLMAALQIRLMLDSYYLLRTGQLFIPFVAITAITNAYISGSLYGTANIFVVAVIARVSARHIQRTRIAASAHALARNFAWGGGA